MRAPCYKCKGKLMCGRDFCPIYAKANSLFQVKDLIKSQDLNSVSPPSCFVGRYNYPYINVGILSPPEIQETPEIYDAPIQWFKESYSIERIIGLRSSLLNSRIKSDVKSSNKILNLIQETAMACKPVSVEIKLEKIPAPFIQTDYISMPMGPTANLKNLQLTSNPRINQKVEKTFYDTDLKATEAINYLYKNEIDENFISKILSIAVLGLKKDRKLVPTRWSVVATYDALCKRFIEEIKQCPKIDKCELYINSYLGNYYLILLFPEVYSYELFEQYMPSTIYNQNSILATATDYEPYTGRKKYAEETAGGFYAAKFPILESLSKRKKQASILVVRFVTDEYTAPLGVWVCKSASKKSIESEQNVFETRESMLDYARKLIKSKFSYNLDLTLSQSKLLKNIRTQTKISQYF